MQQASFCTRLADILQAQKAPNAVGQLVDAKDGLAAQWKDVALAEYAVHACSIVMGDADR